MQSRRIDTRPPTYALIFETGDEVAGGLASFAEQHQLSAAHFTAIGAFQDVTFGYFDWEKKDYTRIPVREQVEVLSLVGDIAMDPRNAESARARHHRKGRWHCPWWASPGSPRQAHLGSDDRGIGRRAAQELRSALKTRPHQGVEGCHSDLGLPGNGCGSGCGGRGSGGVPGGTGSPGSVVGSGSGRGGWGPGIGVCAIMRLMPPGPLALRRAAALRQHQ